MLAAIVTASLKNVDKAFDVRIDIGMGVFERVTNARLGCEMNNDGKTMLREKRFHRRAIGQIQLHKTEIRMTPENFEAGFLEFWIVVVVDDIKPDDSAAGRQQQLRHM